jgi:putative spermidine/putrescine transport system substrate-binding protein
MDARDFHVGQSDTLVCDLTIGPQRITTIEETLRSTTSMISGGFIVEKFFNRILPSAIALAVGIAIVGSPAPAAAGDLDGVTLTAATWGGSWRKRIQSTVVPALTKRGGKVVFVSGNPHENLAKLVAARGANLPFDIIEISENNRKDFIASGVLAKIDYVQIPNAKSIDSRFRQTFMTAHSSTIDGIVYNIDKFKELGLNPPAKYADLANPKLKGRVAFPNPKVVQGIKNMVGLLYEEGGKIPDFSPALSAAKRYNFATYYTSSSKLFAQFKAGDVWAAPWHAGWAVRGRKANLPISIVFPNVEGKKGILSNVWVGIVKGTKNSKAAHAFIESYLSLGAQEALGALNGARPVSQVAANNLQSNPLLMELLPLTQEAISKVYFPNYDAIDFSGLADRFNREVIAK